MTMEWCICKIPTIKEGGLKLQKNEKCLKCDKKIRKFYRTKSGQVLELRIANEFHECRGCGSSIDRGELYFGMTVDDDWGERHTWALCSDCYERRG